MPTHWLTAFLRAWPAAALLAHGCAEPGPALAACQARIVVDFASPTDANVVAAVARDHSLTLRILDRLLANVYVLDLSAGPEQSCDEALATLRTDARVRSADLDARRAPN